MLFVEGGGDRKPLKTECRNAFTSFLDKAGVTKKPRVVACGGRRDAYDSWCTAVSNGEQALLLVDSEAPVAAQHQQGTAPWQHLKQRDGWNKPANTDDNDCHLMVQVMESWFLADRETLASFFGQGFNGHQLPAVANPIEGIAKAQVYQSLANATKNCKTKAEYGKGEHSFKLLARIDPDKVTAASGWAKRFVAEVKDRMGAT
jgi:hypothetical protein